MWCVKLSVKKTSLFYLYKKLNLMTAHLILETCGADFDFFFQPATNSCGGILLAWRRDVWSVSSPIIRCLACLLKSRCYKRMKPGGLHVFMVRNWIMKNRCFWKSLGYVRLARVGGSCGVISISSIGPRTRITTDLIDD